MRIEVELLDFKYARVSYTRTSGVGFLSVYLKGTTKAAARKHIINQYPVAWQEDMSGNITSFYTDVEQMDHIAYDVDWAGAPVGILAVEYSNDLVTWRVLDFGAPLVVNGSSAAAGTFVYPATTVSLTPAPLEVIIGGIPTQVSDVNPMPVTGAALAMVEGAYVDFSLTPVTTLAFTAIHTLVNNSKKVSIVENGGAYLIIDINGSAVGYIAAGEKTVWDFKAVAGDIISLKAVGADATSGKLVLNFFN